MSGQHTFVHRDFMAQVFPVAEYHRHAFWSGQLPLWNPYNADGIPFLAQWSTLVLYPPSLIYLLLPSPWGLACFCLAHVVLAGMGMYLLAWSWTRSRLAASTAGVAYAFTGVLQALLHLPAAMASLGWAPLVVLFAERAWREGGRAVVLAGLVGALQMLGGYPEFILLTWLLVGGLTLGALLAERAPVLRSVRRLGLVVTIVAGLAAAQLLPFVELFAASQRDPAFGAGSPPWALSPTGLAGLLVPLFGAVRSLHGVYFVPGQEYLSSSYMGIAVLGLALLAAVRVRHWKVWVLLGATAVGLVLAMGSHAGVLDALRAVFPPLGVARFPVKFVALSALAVPLLAALALADLSDPGTRRPGTTATWVIGGGLLAGIAVLVAVARAAPPLHEPWTTAAWSGATRALLLVATFGALLALPRLPAQPRRVVALLVVVLVGVDLLTHAPRQNPTVPVEAWAPVELRMPSPPRLGESRAMLSAPAFAYFETTGSPDLVRNLRGHRMALTGNLNLIERIPKVGGHFWVYLAGDYAVRSRLYRTPSTSLPGLEDFLGVSHVSSESDRFGWQRRPGALPLATGGQRPVFADDAEALRALASDAWDPRAVVYLPPEASGEVTARAAPTEVRIRRFKAQAIDLEVEAQAPALVVVAQSHHTPWRARVDGHPTRLWRANVAFQALEVPAGSHRVDLRYEDRALRAGAVLSALTLLACLVALRQRAQSNNVTTRDKNEN